jgi:ACS family pantothenate transporter-like MFS transporter
MTLDNKTAHVEPSPSSAETSSPEGSVVQKEVKRRWLSYIWDTFDKSPEERRLLFKLDTAILTFASLGSEFRVGSFRTRY